MQKRSPYRPRDERQPDSEKRPKKKKRVARKPPKKKRVKATAPELNEPLVVRRSRAPLKALSPEQRKTLKGQAHHLNPVVQIGKHLISQSVVAEVTRALDHHELIKVKFIEGKEDRKTHAEAIAEKTGSFLVSVIGNIAILFREQASEKQRKIWL